MNQHERINQEFAQQYGKFDSAVIVFPTALAAAVLDVFATGEEEPHLEYASLEHFKHMARVFLAKRKGHEADESPAYQSEMQLGEQFSGKLQDRYPLPRKVGEEAAYKRRQDLTDAERAWNVEQLRKSGNARLEHANALEAEGQLRASA